MTMIPRSALRVLAISTIFAAGTALAQPGHGYPPPGHGGVPPGQMRHDRDRDYDRNHDNRRPDWHFQNDARDRFRQRYASNVRTWERRRDRRPNFYPGYAIPRTYVVQSVPRSYYAGLQPPPPGYQYGYYGGYVVAYDPTTRIIADVLDLVGAVANR